MSSSSSFFRNIKSFLSTGMFTVASITRAGQSLLSSLSSSSSDAVSSRAIHSLLKESVVFLIHFPA